MRVDRAGFTVVELMVALLAGGIVLAAAYQAVLVHEEGYQTTEASITDQDVLRVALGVLEGEVREMATVGGTAIGQPDLVMATTDSMRIRAPRTVGFICSITPSDRSMTVWTEGEVFDGGDGVLLFVDGNPATYTDDHWETAEVSTTSTSSETCLASPRGTADQKVHLTSHSLSGVTDGAPVRGYEEVTYRLQSWNGRWGLTRRDGDGTVHRLVSGLAGPTEGLTFRYLDGTGSATSDPASVTAIEITLVTDPSEASGKDPSTVTSTVYLRNN